MDEWVVWFYVEPFTLQLSRDRGRHLLSPIVLVLVPVLVPVLDTVSVFTPSQALAVIFRLVSPPIHTIQLDEQVQ